ncbi:MAG: hypothetical protein ACJA0P_004456 [Planctomycetota bacterium]
MAIQRLRELNRKRLEPYGPDTREGRAFARRLERPVTVLRKRRKKLARK